MPEEHMDVMEQMQKMGEKWTEFKKTWVTHFKDMEIEVQEWNFGVGKNGDQYILDLKAKVAVRPKKK
jgi:hypothetical protein